MKYENRGKATSKVKGGSSAQRTCVRERETAFNAKKREGRIETVLQNAYIVDFIGQKIKSNFSYYDVSLLIKAANLLSHWFPKYNKRLEMQLHVFTDPETLEFRYC